MDIVGGGGAGALFCLPQNLNSFARELYQNFKEQIIPMLSELFQGIKRTETIISFNQAKQH